MALIQEPFAFIFDDLMSLSRDIGRGRRCRSSLEETRLDFGRPDCEVWSALHAALSKTLQSKSEGSLA